MAICNASHDSDSDGYGPACCGGADCDDNNISINPGASPNCVACQFICGSDHNCNGTDDYYDCGGTCGTQQCQPPDQWDSDKCCCVNSNGVCYSPIVIDTSGNGFDLTNAAEGANFDLNSDGMPEHLSWTSRNSDDAWLALDRNRNGKIDNGGELFGSFTPQPNPPPGEQKNGFLALAEYDKAASGGNGDRQIDGRDSIFSSLRLWQDANHNGTSEPGELHTLRDLGVSILDLDYKESKRTDEHGNQFRWRAKVKDNQGAQVGRWAWDVILVRQ